MVHILIIPGRGIPSLRSSSISSLLIRPFQTVPVIKAYTNNIEFNFNALLAGLVH